MNSLTIKAIRRILLFAVAMAALLFVPAWTLNYWQAWVFLAVYFTPTVAITVYLMKYDPELLARRMRAGPRAEKRPSQKIIMAFTSIGFVSLIVLPAIDHRFGWSAVPGSMVIFGDTLIALGFLITFWVFRENAFTSATIEIANDQKVISTGLYAIVRHPMYAGGVLLLVGIPLALGSYWGVSAFVAMLPFLIWRLVDEERLLSQQLPGYIEYQGKVRARLIPGIF
jgi:protein-S-isoprenylcysteine O-methyltransferase Ste14